jgi:hypothetical protein
MTLKIFAEGKYYAFDPLQTWSVLQPWLADRWRKNAQLCEDATEVGADGGEDSVGGVPARFL